MTTVERTGHTVIVERAEAVFRKHRWLFIVQGVLMVLLGMAGLAVPMLATLAVELMIGWLFLFSGIMGLVAMFSARGVGALLWTMLASVLSGITGLFLLARPVAGALSLTIVLAAYLLAQGVLLFVAALEARKLLPGAWGWLLVNGLVDVALAALIISGWPLSAAWVLGVVASVNLICSGVSLLMLAAASRDMERPSVEGFRAG